MAQQKAVEQPIEDVDDLVDELPPGTRLLKGQYTITRYLNSGGFGITYLAKDSLDRDVVIKECFPSSFSRRSKTMVAARSRAHTAELRSVVQLFVKEARNLSKIVHPNIVAVHQVFEDNGTAYMALDFVDGLDLQQIIDGQGKMPTTPEIVVLVEKLLHAIGFIHANDMLHRDISPDNVLIANTGEPVLIDFGAAREQASKSNRAMSALRVVKDGYSPQEFYIAGSEQGPWSDLYALGATFYHLIAGEAPVNGQARLAALAENRPDPYVMLDGRFEGYPPGFLAAIDKSLSTMPKQRVQSAEEWLAMFTANSTISGVSGRVVKSKEPQADVVHDLAKAERTAASFGAPPQFASKTAGTTASAASAKSGVGTVQVLAGIAATLAIVGGAIMMMGGDDAPPVTEVAATAEASAPVAPAAPEDTKPAETAAAPAPEPAPATTATTPAPAPEAETTEAAVAAPEPAAPAPTETAAPESVAAAVPAEATEAPAEPAAAPEEPAVAEAEVAAAPALAAPEGVLRANQVNFAAWDIELPFVEDNRIIGGQRTAIVRGLLPGFDIAEAGTWLAPGILIYTVNGTDVQLTGSVATTILNTMKVDPDGRARVVVEYAGSSLERQAGLMTVPATRLISLGNGLNAEIRTVDGQWQTIVTGVTVPEATSLRQGDVIYRDRTTGIALDTPEALETILADLVEQGVGVTTLSVLRDNRIQDAAMQLAAD
jgi:serine/threonine protein kinase